MAIEIGTAYVNVVPSARGLQANLARELAPISGMAAAEGTKAGSRLGGGFGKGLAGAGVVGAFRTQIGGLSSVLATAGLGVFAKQSIDAASDLNESLSKVNVVFKEGANEVDAWSKTTATGLGISRQAALEAAGTFGGFLISMGLVPDKAQEMGTSLVELAADLASFNNTSPEEALIALRAGLVGEVEPLRRYQVALSAARIEQEAQAAGLNKSSAELSAAEKATFAYQIILKDTSLAQGDFERTSGGLANQQRILAARLKDAQAQLGGKLVPLLLTGATAAIALGKGLNAVNKATDGWLGNLATAAAVGTGVFLAVSKIGAGIRALIGGMSAQAAATTAVTTAQVANTAATEAQVVANAQLASSSVAAGQALTRNLAQGLTAVAVGFIAGKKAGDEVLKAISDAPPKVEDLTESLKRLSKGQTEAFDFSKFGQDFRGAIEGNIFDPKLSARQFFGAFRKQARDAKADVGPLNDALKAVLQTEGVNAATRAYGLLFQGLQRQGVEVGLLTRTFAPFVSALDEARAKEVQASGATKGLTTDLQSLQGVLAKEATTLGIADALDSAQTAVDELADLKLEAAGKGQRSIDAARTERQAQESLSDAYDSQRNSAESLAEAKANLAELDSQANRRISELEKQQIESRVVKTPEEARQKEIDLLKFDQDAIDRREQLQKQVESATDGVTAATKRVEDAEEAVSTAAAARRQVQVDAGAAIAAAERRAEEATLAAAGAILKAKDDQLIGNKALAAYLTLLDGMAEKLDPGSPLSKSLDTFLDKLAISNLLQGHLGPKGPLGPPTFQLPPLGPAGPEGSFEKIAQAAPTSIDYHPTTTVIAPDQPSNQTLNTLNRKQARWLSASGVR